MSSANLLSEIALLIRLPAATGVEPRVSTRPSDPVDGEKGICRTLSVSRQGLAGQAPRPVCRNSGVPPPLDQDAPGVSKIAVIDRTAALRRMRLLAKETIGSANRYS
ncbi:hypothetical protein EFR84_25295 [Rhizobium chutanense]|uniref:Uncharacterized protein n=1 Tax=Rhizobium chutanense TaxID=2035448 RepID=A0A3S0QA18_9HYPH|nr:hypothetical protein EFR84_25295 [Rhizobium chutanense]